MLRSLYTGISGLRSHQTMMDVTGNNIANVNTTGYKTANTIFADTLSQTLAAAGAPQGQQGGTNPAQVGLGVRVAGITTNFSQGATQVTGRNTDMLVDGDGFFVVRQNGINQYTRNGSFNVDGKGQLVSLSGAPVMGWQAQDGAIDTAGITTPITIPAGLLVDAKATENLVMSGNLDNRSTTASAPLELEWPIYDRQGDSQNAQVRLTPQAPASPSVITTEWKVDVTYASKSGTPQTFQATLTRTPASSGPPPVAAGWTAAPGAGTAAPTTAGAGRVQLTGLVGADGVAFDVDLDMGKLTSSASTQTAKVESQDGATAATLQSWQLGPDGTITGTFSNGRTTNIAKVAIANFDNPVGLDKQGGSLYAATVNSGEPAIGSPGDAGRGTLVSGALEMSNVDLAQEFTNLIVSQRGFQANSRVITSSDEMLQELVNLKR